MQQSTDAYMTFPREVQWLFGSLFAIFLPLEEENGSRQSRGGGVPKVQ